MEEEDLEKGAFIEKKPPQVTFSHDEEEAEKKRRCCSWCTKCRCASIAVAVLVLIGLVLGMGYYRIKSKYGGTAAVTSTQEILAALNDEDVKGVNKSLSGTYELFQYDERYRDYLIALGTPRWVVDSFILGFNDVYTFDIRGN